jgi:hypothetical protein
LVEGEVEGEHEMTRRVPLVGVFADQCAESMKEHWSGEDARPVAPNAVNFLTPFGG